VRRTPRRSEYDACRSDSTEDLLFFLDYAARDEAFCAITSRAVEVLEWVWSRSGDDVLTVLPGFLLCPDWVFCMKGLVSEWADTASEEQLKLARQIDSVDHSALYRSSDHYMQVRELRDKPYDMGERRIWTNGGYMTSSIRLTYEDKDRTEVGKQGVKTN
jgi:hypothetical protein